MSLRTTRKPLEAILEPLRRACLAYLLSAPVLGTVGAAKRVTSQGVGSEPTQKRKSRHLRELQAGVALHGGLPVAWGSLLRTWPSTALLLGSATVRLRPVASGPPPGLSPSPTPPY